LKWLNRLKQRFGLQHESHDDSQPQLGAASQPQLGATSTPQLGAAAQQLASTPQVGSASQQLEPHFGRQQRDLRLLNRLQQRFDLQHESQDDSQPQLGAASQPQLGAASQPQPLPNSVNACASLAPANTNIAATNAAAIRNRLFMGRAPQSTKI
jgi:hypothetical protein